MVADVSAMKVVSGKEGESADGVESRKEPPEKASEGTASQGSTSADAAEVEDRVLPSSSPKRFTPAKLFDKDRFVATANHDEGPHHAAQPAIAETILPDWVEQSVFTQPTTRKKPSATPVAAGYDGSTPIVLSPCSSPGVETISRPPAPSSSAASTQQLGTQTHGPRLEGWEAYAQSEAAHASAPPRPPPPPLPERPPSVATQQKSGFPTPYRPLYTHQPLGQQARLPQLAPQPSSQPHSPSQPLTFPPSQPQQQWWRTLPQVQPRSLPQTALPEPGRQMLPPAEPPIRRRAAATVVHPAGATGPTPPVHTVDTISSIHSPAALSTTSRASSRPESCNVHSPRPYLCG